MLVSGISAISSQLHEKFEQNQRKVLIEYNQSRITNASIDFGIAAKSLRLDS